MRAEQLIAELDALLREFPELADDEELRADTLEGETEYKQVLTRLASHALDAKAQQGAIAQLIDGLASRQGRFARREAAFRTLIKRVMEAAQSRKEILPNATVSIRAVPPSVVISNESELPAEYLVTKTSPDKKAIAEALKAGAVIPGAVLSNGSETLSLRS